MGPSTMCHMCGKEFKYSFSLNRHLRELHEQVTVHNKSKDNFKCVICKECCKDHKHFSKHVSEKHNIDLKKESIEFTNSEVFYNWKNKIEDEEKSFFAKKRAKQQPKNCVTIHFFCNRRGFFKPEVTESERKKKLKIQGTSKIAGYCPAGIKAIFKEDGSVFVEYTSTHVGHNTDLAHLHLKFDQRKNIADKIAMNIPFDDILNEVTSSARKYSVNRQHLITKCDLYNIKKEFSRAKKAVNQTNDNEDTWIQREGTSENNCIIVEGEITEEYPVLFAEDLILEISSREEAESAILREVGSNVEISSVDEQKQLIEAKMKSILNNVSTLEGIQIINKTLDSMLSKLNVLEQDIVVDDTFKTNGKVPSSSNSQPQKHFISVI